MNDHQRWTPGRNLLSPLCDLPPQAYAPLVSRETRLSDVVGMMECAALAADLYLSRMIKAVKQSAGDAK